VRTEDDNIFIKKFGERVANIRKAQKLTKVQLAFEINTSESNIRRIEKGQVNVGLSTIRKLSIALDVPLKELLDFEID